MATRVRHRTLFVFIFSNLFENPKTSVQHTFQPFAYSTDLDKRLNPATSVGGAIAACCFFSVGFGSTSFIYSVSVTKRYPRAFSSVISLGMMAAVVDSSWKARMCV